MVSRPRRFPNALEECDLGIFSVRCNVEAGQTPNLTARHLIPVSLLGQYLEAEVGIERLAASTKCKLCLVALRIPEVFVTIAGNSAGMQD
jgi:hypothetical protein